VLELLERELSVHGITILGRNVCKYKGREMVIPSCIKLKQSSIKKNKKLLLSLWKGVAEEIAKTNTGDSCSITRRIFIPAIKSLYGQSLRFSELRDNGVADALKTAIGSDSDNFSGSIMSRVVDFRLAIDWLDYLIRRELYCCCLLNKMQHLLKDRLVEARGISGPWSNLDLPMQERVFEWEDIEEETAGREQDKRKQRRYRQGLDNYGEGDNSPNSGFYWREIRNEPYAFNDTSETLYPHRNLLWI